MDRLIQLGALACLYLGAESKALRWQDDTPSWSPPRETIAAMDMMELGISPVPTAAPDPANVELKLAKRVRGDDTCGYISGESTASIYCEVGTCVINSFYSVVGCCASATMSDCRIATGCLPSSSSRFYTTSDSLMLFCNAASATECATYVYSDPVFTRYTLYNCNSVEKRVVVYANPTTPAGGNSQTRSPITDPTNTPSPTTISPGPATTSATPPPTGGGSSTPTGAIVGGVVGGLAAIGLIIFGVVFLLRKKKKNNGPGDNNNGQVPPVAYNPQQPQPGQQPPQMYQAPPPQQPSPGGYAPPAPGVYPTGFAPVDNRQSMLKQPYDVTTGNYEQNNGISPPASPPPVSPSPTYQSGVPAYVQSQGNGPSPTQAGYPPPQQQQQQGGYYNAPPVQTQQQPHQQQTTTHAHHPHHSYASELPATRGDGELRELA
ncbi:uncharacterized protein CTRU02_201916 [Colletotrichum truncatum]|uniref:Uncharacterized protein n=1 Tax=Colletotrichum truncatum TaxID=5467 RepID=A0ACC3ZIT8_COLTU|nr:uncharacterized protein CTRU02_07027 [Colletotrichum truncatum]KAF6791843.1 hypothetical protein CTRU02_07027 [Colletotrichum truncatum]